MTGLRDEAFGGVDGLRVGTGTGLKSVRAHCLDRGGSHLVENPIDYGEKERVAYEELRHRSLALEAHRHA